MGQRCCWKKSLDENRKELPEEKEEDREEIYTRVIEGRKEEDAGRVGAIKRSKSTILMTFIVLSITRIGSSSSSFAIFPSHPPIHCPAKLNSEQHIVVVVVVTS